MNKKIKLARVDSRMLHATVAVNWSKFVNANYAIVIDPDHDNDPFIEKVMRLCLPKHMSVNFFSVEEFLHFINSEESFEKNVMVIFKNLKSVCDLVSTGFTISRLQLPYPASRMLIKRLEDHFNSEEINQITFLQNHGVELYFQTAPHDTKEYAIFKKERRG